MEDSAGAAVVVVSAAAELTIAVDIVAVVCSCIVQAVKKIITASRDKIVIIKINTFFIFPRFCFTLVNILHY
ncbi:MAG: hypothetical protein IMZ47_06685 [Firmicutes bacterium]|nr:hypothetical protein [Bacillota bacterium]